VGGPELGTTSSPDPEVRLPPECRDAEGRVHPTAGNTEGSNADPMPRTDTYWSAVYKSWKAVGAVDGLCIEAGRTLPGVYRCFEIHTCLSMPNRDDLNVVIDDTETTHKHEGRHSYQDPRCGSSYVLPPLVPGAPTPECTGRQRRRRLGLVFRSGSSYPRYGHHWCPPRPSTKRSTLPPSRMRSANNFGSMPCPLAVEPPLRF
jgi:hypothetical protein